jgi:hypothetical protein
MSGFPILDVVIGLSFIYLLLALVCTTLMEWIAQIKNLRGEMLEQATRRILGEETAPNASVTTAYLEHPLIRGLKDGSRKPSYIPATVFAKALRDVLGGPPGRSVTAPAPSADLQQSFNALAAAVTPPPAGKKVRGAQPVPSEQSLADWYDVFMERVSGTYRRQTRITVLLLAIGVTIVMNADSVTLIRNLWQDPTLRAYVVERAKVRLEQGPPLETVEYTDPTTPVPTAPIASDSTTSPDRLLVEEQDLLGMLFGWTNERASLQSDQARWGGPFWGAVVWSVRHLIGWVLTALAVSLGAPFWFDTLNRFMKLRATGDPQPKPATKKA